MSRKFNFPNPSIVYVRADEAQFRAMVERAFNTLAGEKQNDQPPSIDMRLDQSGSTGTMTVTVKNPGKNWLGFVRFKELSGPGDFDATDPADGTWTTDSTTPFSADVTLEPKHGAIIAVAAPWRDLAGDLQWEIKEHRFDSDHDAELTGHELTFDTAGYPLLSLTGDEDVAKHYVTMTVGDDIAGATPSDPTASVKDATLSSRQGRLRFDGAASVADKQAKVGKIVGYKVVCENDAGAVNAQVFGPYFRRRGDTKYQKPGVQVIGVRSGTTVTVTLTTHDQTLAVTAIEFRKKNSGGSLDGSFVSTWDTSTGTIGTDETLTRAEAVTSEAGLDARFIWRVTYTDEFGNAQTLGDEIDLAHLEQVSKSLKFGPMTVLPAGDTTTWAYGSYVNGATPGTLSAFYGSVPIPKGVALTNLATRMYCNHADDAAITQFVRYDADGVATVLLTQTHTAAEPSWETVSDSLSEDATETAAYDYVLIVSLTPRAAGVNADARFRYAELSYNAPSYDKSY